MPEDGEDAAALANVIRNRLPAARCRGPIAPTDRTNRRDRSGSRPSRVVQIKEDHA